MPTVDEVIKNALKKYDLPIGPLGSIAEDVQAYSTGNLAIDHLTGVGGLPAGRSIEMYGTQSCGKTTLAIQTCVTLQRIIKAGGNSDPTAGPIVGPDDKIGYFDFEHAMDPVYVAALGLDTKHPSFLFCQPTTLEQGANVARALVETGDLRLMVWDSIPGAIPSSKSEAEIGKSQPLHALVLTPVGWRKMGELQVGDAVVDPYGEYSTVTRITQQGTKQTYRVTFEDGRSAESSEDHLWEILNPNAKRDGKATLTLSLREIIERRDRLQKRVHVPLVIVPYKGMKRSYPVDPYVLGLMLGDGCMVMKTPMFTTMDAELIESISARLPANIEAVLNQGTLDNTAKSYYFSMTYIAEPFCGNCEGDEKLVGRGLCQKCWRAAKNEGRLEFYPADGRVENPFRAALKRAGVWGKTAHGKRVPETYLDGESYDRLAVLQGLLDTDGHVTANGVVEFCSVSPGLADDVAYLVRSLGGRARVSTKGTTHSDAYLVHIVLPTRIVPFRLARKKARAEQRRGDGTAGLAISSIEPVRTPEFHQCIAVSARSKLYVTDDFVVTHNSLPAVAAKLYADFISALNEPLHRNNCTAIYINHLAEVMGMSGGQRPGMPPLTTTPGGRALKFYASVRIEFRPLGSVKEKYIDPLTKEEIEQITATNVKVKIVKNKVGPPQRQALVRVRWGKGFDNFWTALQILIAHKKVVYSSGYFYFEKSPELVHIDMARQTTGTKRPYVRTEVALFAFAEQRPEWRDQAIASAAAILVAEQDDISAEPVDLLVEEVTAAGETVQVDPATGEIITEEELQELTNFIPKENEISLGVSVNMSDILRDSSLGIEEEDEEPAPDPNAFLLADLG